MNQRIQLIYDRAGNTDPMKVVFFFSGGASSMEYILNHSNHGGDYEVIGAVTNRSEKKAAKGYDIARSAGVDVVYVNPGDFEDKKEFYGKVKDAVDDFGADVVGLSGFVGRYSIITPPFLDSYQNMIINVHPADLSILTKFDSQVIWDAGKDLVRKYRIHTSDSDSEDVAAVVKKGTYRRQFTGDDPVAMSTFFGEEYICSTIHIAEEDLDGGKILVQSKKVPIDTEFVKKSLSRNSLERIMEYATKLQERMKTECDGPAFEAALDLISTGRLGVDRNTVYLDGKKVPYGGVQLGDLDS